MIRFLGPVVAVLLVLAVGVALGSLILVRSLPKMRGKIVLQGVDEPVTIHRDRWGVPHVYAKSMADAALAMGFMQGQDRLWQLELVRRVAMGRISEFAGEQGLASDRFIRRLGLMRVALREVETLDEETKLMLERYCQGVNTVIYSKRRPLPIEFALLKIQPELWQPAHCLAVAKLINFGLSLNSDIELQKLELLRAIGPEKAALLNLEYPEDHPRIMRTIQGFNKPALASLRDLYAEAARWIPSYAGASNSWVVNKNLSETGRSILCNDPHLMPSVPSAWYQVHVTVEGDFSSTGVTLPGSPFTVIGHNEHIAWGYTNSFADVQDLVIEEFENADAKHFLTEKGWAKSEIVQELIRVKNHSDVFEDIVVTRHGPIIQRVDDPAQGVFRGLSLQWTGLQPGTSALALLKLQRAKDWNTFRSAQAYLDGPSQNAIYADTSGNIGYFLSGRIPLRRRSPSYLPVPGWTGEGLWLRYLSIDEVPQTLNPPENFIVTANNRIVNDNYPFHISFDYMNGYRAARIAELLAGKLQNLDSMRQIQMDITSIPAKQAIGLMSQIRNLSGKAEAARRQFLAWDAKMHEDSYQASLYQAFIRRLAEYALRPLCGEAWPILAGTNSTHPVFDYPNNILGRLVPVLLNAWRGEDPRWLEGKKSWDQTAADAWEAAVKDLSGYSPNGNGRWGQLHRLSLAHPLVQASQGLKLWLTRTLFRPATFPIGGDTDTIMSTAFNPAKPFGTKLWVPTWRQVIDVGGWDNSTGIHCPGQSGQPGSRHYKDLIKLWRDNQQIPLAWSQEAVAVIRRHTLHLIPPGLSQKHISRPKFKKIRREASESQSGF